MIYPPADGHPSRY